MSEKKALTRETAKLYQKSQKHQKTEILDHFVSITGYHRKYALTLLGSWGKEIIKTINGKPKNCGRSFAQTEKTTAGMYL